MKSDSIFTIKQNQLLSPTAGCIGDFSDIRTLARGLKPKCDHVTVSVVFIVISSKLTQKMKSTVFLVIVLLVDSIHQLCERLIYVAEPG